MTTGGSRPTIKRKEHLNQYSKNSLGLAQSRKWTLYASVQSPSFGKDCEGLTSADLYILHWKRSGLRLGP